MSKSDQSKRLLTQSGTINEDTLKEIKRLEATHVVIVGGAVGDAVAIDLAENHGLTVETLKGKTRYETSNVVADRIAELKNTPFEQVFVVGGYAMADALSVSAVAAETISPILLTDAETLNPNVKYFINKNIADKDENTDVYIVGGTGSVKAQVQKDLVEIAVGNDSKDTIQVERLCGEDGTGRQDTNAAVITEFAGLLEDVVVAKSDNKGMVDALAAGAYAAKMDSHIVLATNSLTVAQEDAISAVNKHEDNNTDDKNTNKLVQAGYNVAKAAVAKISSLMADKK